MKVYSDSRNRLIIVAVCLSGLLPACNSRAKQNEKLQKQSNAKLKEAADLLAGIRDVEGAKSAEPRLRQTLDEMNKINSQLSKSYDPEDVDSSERPAMTEAVAQGIAEMQRLVAESLRISQIPGVAAALGDTWDRLPSAMMLKRRGSSQNRNFDFPGSLSRFAPLYGKMSPEAPRMDQSLNSVVARLQHLAAAEGRQCAGPRTVAALYISARFRGDRTAHLALWLDGAGHLPANSRQRPGRRGCFSGHVSGSGSQGAHGSQAVARRLAAPGGVSRRAANSIAEGIAKQERKGRRATRRDMGGRCCE